MAQKVVDARGSRTKAALQRAFKSLLQRKAYESIAVDEICKAANVGRSTFYTHFRSKDDLKRSGLESLRRQLVARQKTNRAHGENRPPPMSFTFDLFAHARDHVDHYRTLVGGRGGTVILGKLKDTVAGLVRAELATAFTWKASDSVEREAAVQYVVGAFMALLTWWLDRGATMPVERIDELFRRFMRDGVFSPPR